MMFFVSLLAAALAGLSGYFILHQFVTLPSAKTEKVILNLGKPKGFNASLEMSLVIPFANKIEPFLRLEEYQRDVLQQTLHTAGIQSSAEKYTAAAIGYGVLIFLFCLPLAVLISPVLFLAGLAAGFFAYKGRIGAAQKLVTEKRLRIEAELPRFSSTIHEQLSTTRDVVKIFETYRKICPRDFEEEITKTLADMKTGNHEAALRNFENRMGSYKLSEVVRGLIGVLNGNNQIMHFEILTNDLIKSENEALRREAQKRPGKLMPDEILMFGGLLLMLCVAIGQYALQSAQTFL